MMGNLKKYYQNLYEVHGRNSKSVQHVSYMEQRKRFEILSDNVGLKDKVIDLGCGLADFYFYLKSNGFEGQYLGLDFVDQFIKSNREHYWGDQNAKFQVFDLYQDYIVPEYDHIILCGVFNNKMADNYSFMKTSVRKMYAAANQSISFNMLSTYVDYQDDALYYFDPKEVFDFCKKEISPFVTLKHDYGLGGNNHPYEFTLFIRKN